MTKKALFYLITLLLPFVGASQLVHVDPVGGNNAGGCGTAGNPCETIQYTVDLVANAGDTIYLHSGTYSLAQAVTGLTAIVELPADKSFHFVGDSIGTGALLDGGSKRRGFHYDHSSGCSISGTVQNNMAETHRFSFTNLRFENCHYHSSSCGSTTHSRGGAICIMNDPLDSLIIDVKDSDFLSNWVTDTLGANNSYRSAGGGAIYVNGRTMATNSAPYAQLNISGSQFNDNRAIQGANGGHGGAVSAFTMSSVNIINCGFCDNHVFGINSDNGDLDRDRNAGGAVCFFDLRSTLPGNVYNISNCSFANNTATTTNGTTLAFPSEGGAVFLTRGDIPGSSTSGIVNISNSDFYNNSLDAGVIEHADANSGTLNTAGNGNSFQNQFNAAVDLGPDTTICPGATLVLDATLPGASYEWNNGSTTSTYTITSNSPTTIWVEVSLGGCTVSDTIVVDQVPLAFAGLGDTAVCAGNNVLIEPLVNNLGIVWHNGSTDSTFLATTFGNYWYLVTDSNGCTAVDTVRVTQRIININTLTPSTTGCDSISISAGIADTASLVWNTGDTAHTIVVDSSGAYWFLATTDEGCLVSDSISALVLGQPVLPQLADDTLCPGESFEVISTDPLTQISTSNQSSLQSLIITDTGQIIVKGENLCGAIFDTVIISIVDPIEIKPISDTLPCGVTEVELTVQANTDMLLWDNGSQNATRLFDAAGNYSYSVFTKCELIRDSFRLDFYQWEPQYEGDTTICGPSFVPDIPAGVSLYDSFGNPWGEREEIVESEMLIYEYFDDCQVSRSETLSVTIFPMLLPFVPNSFTPDGNLFNETWKPSYHNEAQLEFTVYSRWGERLYYTKNNQPWDGTVDNKPVPQGIYPVTIRYINCLGQDQLLTHYINLLR